MGDGCVNGWMDGSELGCAAHVKGSAGTVKEDEGMDGMGWDGMGWYGRAGEWYGAGCGTVRQGRYGRAGGWWVAAWCMVWAEFGLGCCWSEKGRRAAAGRQELGELGELGAGGQEQGSRGRQNVAGGAHTHTHTHTHTTAGKRETKRQTLVTR